MEAFAYCPKSPLVPSITSHGRFEYHLNANLWNLVWKHMCDLTQSFILDDPACITFDHATARVRRLVAIRHSADSISRVGGRGERLYSTAFDPHFQLGISFEALRQYIESI